MSIFQVSVFVENKQGRLADITEVLSSADINIRALCVADTTHFGILRLIVNAPEKAMKILTENGFTASLTNVIGVIIPDSSGALTAVLRSLSNGGISVEYMYAFVSKKSGKAGVILRVEDEEKAVSVLSENGTDIMDGEVFDG